MTVMEWNNNQSYNQTKEIPSDGLFRGVGSKEITWTYTGNGYQPILKIAPSQNWEQTATIENLVIDGQNKPYTTGILLKGVCNCQVRNVTIKNCKVGIQLETTSEMWCESNNIQHVRMMNVDKGIVFDKGTGTGSFAFTTIDNVGISLKDDSSSIGIVIGNATQVKGCHPYNSIIRATVWMGPDNPGTGMLIEGGSYHGELRGGLGILWVYNSGDSTGATGIDLDGSIGAIKDNQTEFMLAWHNLQTNPERRVYQDGGDNDIRLVEF